MEVAVINLTIVTQRVLPEGKPEKRPEFLGIINVEHLFEAGGFNHYSVQVSPLSVFTSVYQLELLADYYEAAQVVLESDFLP
jgi:hypothetical protein